ncbi:D-alanyl-D-alanine carboxypeptidase/D-alanyl-D-alanine-endopeptidase [Nocardioides sp. zg-536]|uniref:D-alanyl-D-alanine carboxypeptidase/D-alanyl-D-alanine-endopeptidase n=1 Tax=Nocardioides faecalis TaxID=2803858 RepID=A0A938Y849_9ACTN|nr:D-alanyl-D-alanine carboxypeptidase/D-alanyl-D-alanine-endopeptidase [Nocardioides faecalis]MBM9461030.1 D-alanyl-D-alanine carboxypeptidase/D-alanyl-D-alanine-endopeptidase [Nocardioides faecalis]QVI59118.1 D-alanyl-D-alanine carboxypeptidase/D-alanyl-D-alanine-endopeptidase [Nocardioides faecalis]
MVILLVAAVVGWRTGWAEEQWDRWRNGTDPTQDPAAVAPPPELDLPEVVAPQAVGVPADTVPLDKAAVAKALAALGDPALGRRVLAAVGPLEGSGVTYRKGPAAAVAIPASTTKVVTAAVALLLLGGEHVFETTTVLDPGTEPAPGSGAGTTTPRLTLVGGGDPYLAAKRSTGTNDPARTASAEQAGTFDPARADVRTLARRTAKALTAQGVTSVSLGYDDSLFTGPAVNPTWEPDYLPSEIGPVSALTVDQGRDPDRWGYVTDPAAQAARVFRRALVRAGIEVVGPLAKASAAPGAEELAGVDSPPLAQIVQRAIEVSDNVATEALLRHIGIAEQGEGSFVGGQESVARALTANGIALGRSVLYDGSGLSRDNRLSPDVLLGVLRLAASDEHPGLRPLLAALPVAGFSGSLTNRMAEGAAAQGRGRVRAKTGTLRGVSSLAGIAVDAQGNPIAFALMADRLPEGREGLGRLEMDAAAAGLGACSCGR